MPKVGGVSEATPLCNTSLATSEYVGGAATATELSDRDLLENDPRETATNANSIFFDGYTSASFEEMKNSALERCCPGDGIGAGSLSLLSSAVTPTLLSIPLAFAVGGPAFAAGSILFCVTVTFLSVRILALASASAGTEEYETVAGFFLGWRGKWIVRGILFFYNFGCSVVYLGFIKDSASSILMARATFMPLWLRSDVGGVISLVLLMFVITPLTFNSRLASLRTKGFISNILIVFIVGAVVYRFFVPEAEKRGELPGMTEAPRRPVPEVHAWYAWLLPYLFAGPIFVFSYEVQSNVMGVIKDLHDYTGRRILVCISLALLIATLFYGTTGVFGSLSFKNTWNGNLLSNYDMSNDNLIFMCQVFCCFSASVSFVFCVFPCRAAFAMFLSDGKSTRIPRRQRVRISILLSTCACLMAAFLPDVATVVSLLGALFSATLSMTFPSIFALRMRSSGTYLTSRVDGVLTWMLLFLGIGFSTVGTLMAIFFWMYG